MRRNKPLAALVRKGVADEAINSLKTEGCYDRDRRIREYDGDALAIPVTDPPSETIVDEIIRQSDPPWRIRDLADRLRERGFTATEIERTPTSWSVIGEIITARFTDCPRPEAVGEALLELHGNAHTVLGREGITGPEREPSVSVIAGRGETETVHQEYGIEYALDLSSVMFAPGNKAERKRMGEVVTPGELVFDMFAGIGYFTLPMARAGARVIATDRNPPATAYLEENSRRNGVSDRVSIYQQDCRNLSVPPSVDRVVMGHYDAPEYLEVAVDALGQDGILHLHSVEPERDRWSHLEARLESAGTMPIEIRERRVVKSHAPGMEHVVIDAEIEP